MQSFEVTPSSPEDFAAFAEKVPGLYVKMGVRNEAKGITAMIHTEDFDIDVLRHAAHQLIAHPTADDERAPAGLADRLCDLAGTVE